MVIADYEVTLQELSYIKDYGWNRYAMSKQDTNVNFDWVR